MSDFFKDRVTKWFDKNFNQYSWDYMDLKQELGLLTNRANEPAVDKCATALGVEIDPEDANYIRIENILRDLAMSTYTRMENKRKHISNSRLEARVARLEQLLSKERSCIKQCKFEYGTYGPAKETLLADAKELKALLKNKGIIDPEVNPDGDYLIVSLDWEYYGPGAFLVLPADNGYILQSDRYNKRKKLCRTLDEVADSIPDIDYE